MKLILDCTEGTLAIEDAGERRTLGMYTKEAFELLSHQWVKLGWNQKYSHTFSWMGRPIIQLSEDMVRIQEVIYCLKPDVIIETGVAHGGSLIFYASLCKVMGQGRVIGIDTEIRPHNRKALEAHELFPYLTLLEGSSIAPEIMEQVKTKVKPNEFVLVVLDSCHTKQHVMQELECYAPLVAPGSYVVATDGIMRDLWDVPRGKSEWKWDNPIAAAEEFVVRHPEFVIEEPEWPFNESHLTRSVTHWPGAYLRRKY